MVREKEYGFYGFVWGLKMFLKVVMIGYGVYGKLYFIKMIKYVNLV